MRLPSLPLSVQRLLSTGEMTGLLRCALVRNVDEVPGRCFCAEGLEGLRSTEGEVFCDFNLFTMIILADKILLLCCFIQNFHLILFTWVFCFQVLNTSIISFMGCSNTCLLSKDSYGKSHQWCNSQVLNTARSFSFVCLW